SVPPSSTHSPSLTNCERPVRRQNVGLISVTVPPTVTCGPAAMQSDTTRSSASRALGCTGDCRPVRLASAGELLIIGIAVEGGAIASARRSHLQGADQPGQARMTASTGGP